MPCAHAPDRGRGPRFRLAAGGEASRQLLLLGVGLDDAEVEFDRAWLTVERDHEVLVGVLPRFAGQVGDSQAQIGRAYVVLLLAPGLERS